MTQTPDEIKKAYDKARKTFRIMFNIGKSKYVVNFCDGQKAHRDGSPFFDIRIFKNKRIMASFITDLKHQGYSEA